MKLLKVLDFRGLDNVAPQPYNPDKTNMNADFGVRSLEPGMRWAELGITASRIINARNTASAMDVGFSSFYRVHTSFVKTIPGITRLRSMQTEEVVLSFGKDLGIPIVLEKLVPLTGPALVSKVTILRCEHRSRQFLMEFIPTYAAIAKEDEYTATARIVGSLRLPVTSSVLKEYVIDTTEHATLGDPSSEIPITRWLASAVSLRVSLSGDGAGTDTVIFNGARLLKPGPRIRSNKPIGRTI